MPNSYRKQRPSFLRPFTPISPVGLSKVDSASSAQKENSALGPTSRASIPSSVYGIRPRSKSASANQTPASFSVPDARIARNGVASFGATPAGSAASSRRSSFAPGIARRQSSIRDPTVSRRGSVWSEFGDEAALGGQELTEEEKVIEAQKAFANSIKVLWESGVDRIAYEAWTSFAQGWKAGDVIGLISVDHFSLPRVERARIIVLIDDLQLQLQQLATATLGLPEAITMLQSPSPSNLTILLDALLESPAHVQNLLRVLDSAAKLWLRAAPSIMEQLSTPQSMEDTLDHMLNLCAFLTGSSTDLRRAVLAALSYLKESAALLNSASKAVVSIYSTAPSKAEDFTPSVHPTSSSIYLPSHTLAQWAEITGYVNTLLSQPRTASSIDLVRAEVKALWNALIGNARVARAARGLERIWNNDSTTFRQKAVSIITAIDGALQWEIESISSVTDDFRFTFGALRPQLSQLIPEEVAFTYAPIGVNARHESPSSVVLRGLRLVINDATFEIRKTGLLAFSDTGLASITVPFDLEIWFGEEGGGQPEINMNFNEKQEIGLQSGGKSEPNALTRIWNSWLSTVVKSRISESIKERIVKVFEEWISPLYTEVSPSPVSATGRIPVTREGKKPVFSPLSAGAGSGTAQGARAAFLASLRMTSGIDVKPLATGRDVLNSLENPFGSGPNSAAIPDNEEEESDSSDLKGRRMSMAMSLTDISKSDVTNVENIANPPRAQSISHMVVGEAPAPSSARRLSLAFTPIGEPSLESYDDEFAPSATTESATSASRPTGSLLRRSSSTMADSLDAIAEIDTTTVEGIRAADNMFKYGFNNEDYRDQCASVPMAQVTKELLEGSKKEIEERNVPAAVERTPSRRESDIVPRPIRRKSMSEYLTEAAMVDQTDATLDPAPRHRAEALEESPKEDLPPMSTSLDATASIDATLPENIASPPRSRHLSFSADSLRGRSKSFVELNDAPAMADIGTDENITKDQTEVDPRMPRIDTAKEDTYVGIDPAELKKRRMSSFMSEISNVDTTLLENIQHPPATDQTYHEVVKLPHSLPRRLSTAAPLS